MSRTTTTTTTTLLAALGALTIALPLSAQPGVTPADAPREPPPVNAQVPNFHELRRGLTLGASIGRGSIDIGCEGCGDLDSLDEALSYSVHAGFILRPRLAVVAEFWDIRYDERNNLWFSDSDDHLVSQQYTTIGAQAWFTKRFWIRGSAGFARHISDSKYARERGFPGGRVPAGDPAATAGERQPASEDSPSHVPAVTGALGWEFASTPNLGLDLQLRLGTSRHSDEGFSVTNAAVSVGVSWF